MSHCFREFSLLEGLMPMRSQGTRADLELSSAAAKEVPDNIYCQGAQEVD